MPVLAPEQLCRRCDPAELAGEMAQEARSAPGILGQERAVEAIELGVAIDGDGFNIFAIGPQGLGKWTLVTQILERAAARRDSLPDWCYVHNFEHAHRPSLLKLPSGMGTKLRDDMTALVEDFRAAVPAALESDEHRSRVHEAERESEMEHERMMQDLAEKADSRSLRLLQTPTGFAFAPAHGDSILSPDEFEKLPDEEKEKLNDALEELRQELRAVVERMPQIFKKARDKVRELNRETAGAAVAHSIAPLRERYAELPQVLAYLDAVQQDAAAHATELVKSDEEMPAFLGIQMPDMGGRLERYRVNVLVDNSGAKGAPVIYEDHPTFQNLLGRIEHVSRFGTLVTDFTLLKPGSLHRANGGYLVIEADRLLRQPFAWEGLKRAMQSRCIKIESLGEALSLVSTVSLEPEPIPLDVKVVVLADRYLHLLFSTLEPDFPELFKVVADFEEEYDRTSSSTALYARSIQTIAEKEGLAAFAPDAQARIVEESARWSGDSEKLSANLRQLRDLICEAHHWAHADGAQAVDARHVEKAVDNQERRMSRMRDLSREYVRRGMVLIDTSGATVGQVNGLSVVGWPGYSFGQPSRITATARTGQGEVIDIEREVELGGPLHSKGVLILSSFLSSRYCTDRPLSLSASLVFEQSYGKVEGDSASLAELCALLSTLAGAPIRQALAVTGSVNQLGQVQPIGGVNEKIEGFFDVCAERGLTGEQGVLIPAANIPNLMLRRRVVDAVREGKFAIHAVATVDEAITLLTGIEAGARDSEGLYPEDSVNGRVEERLAEMSESIKAFLHEKDSEAAG